MDRPGDIQRRAVRLFPEFLTAWLDGDDFFPRRIAANLKLDPHDHTKNIRDVEALRAGAKERTGFGYSIGWRERRSRDFGRNSFPVKITVETRDDYLRLTGRQAEFAAFSQVVTALRAEFPELESWVRSHRQKAIDIAPELDGLRHVLRYFQAHPRPDCYVRELPLPVDTKFIERHKALLTDWLGRVLPPETIRSEETHFERRFGLRCPELFAMVRFLDPQLQHEAESPWSELSLPLSALTALNLRDIQVIVVENKINLLTLPCLPRSIGLGALGRAVTELRQARWMESAALVYWGDMDVEGFEILSSLRAVFPQTASRLMDEAALQRFRSLASSGSGRAVPCPPHLTEPERAAFDCCCRENLRIEQEHIVPSAFTE